MLGLACRLAQLHSEDRWPRMETSSPHPLAVLSPESLGKAVGDDGAVVGRGVIERSNVGASDAAIYRCARTTTTVSARYRDLEVQEEASADAIQVRDRLPPHRLRRPQAEIVWFLAARGTGSARARLRIQNDGVDARFGEAKARAAGDLVPSGGLLQIDDLLADAETLGDARQADRRPDRAVVHDVDLAKFVDVLDTRVDFAVPAPVIVRVRHIRRCNLDMDPPASRSCIGAARARMPWQVAEFPDRMRNLTRG